MPRRTRPLGLSIIAALLALLAICGFANSYIWAQLSATLPADTPADFRALVSALASPLVSAAAILCGITGLSAAVGAWLIRSWAPTAILAWGVAAFALGSIFLLRIGQLITPAPTSLKIAAAMGLALTVAIVTGIFVYVRRKTLHPDA